MGKFVDMAMTPQETLEDYGAVSSPPDVSKLPKYPYGLCISLCKDEIDKLGLDVADLEIGDFLHLHSMARVTSFSIRETEGGSDPRIELTLAFIEVEDEGEEDDEADKMSKKDIPSKLYTSK